MLLLFSMRVACLEKDTYIFCSLWCLLSICVCPSFPSVFAGGMRDLIVLILDNCLSICLCDNVTGFQTS